MKKRTPRLIIALAFMLVLTPLLSLPQAAFAATFNYNMILTDNELENSLTMTVSQIQRFLELKGSGLARYATTDVAGAQKSAAQIIYDAARYWRINPQYLIVRMQVEQSLITTASPTQRQLDWATGFGVCDSCSVTDPAVIKYKGFFSQVNWAARRFRESYLPDIESRGYTFTGWGPGITKRTGDGYLVTPVNKATAGLYTYTPHVYNGNYNVWRFFNEWFTKVYPDGSLLQAQGEQGVYFIQSGKKRPIMNRSALVSRFDPTRIIIVSRTTLELYPNGEPIKFANYSLIRSQNTGRVWLIDGDLKRYIESPDVFRKIGFNPEEVVNAPEGDLTSYTRGQNINMQSIYPTGVLLQSKESGGITYVENGIRHAIVSREILQNRFPTRRPVIVEEATIREYAAGDPILFKDGELVTSPGSNGVYYISNGQRRGIASPEVMETLGLKWKNLIRTTDKSVFLHPEGPKLNVK
ncbi:MAG: hypothetical protein HZC01_04825 [Candidatus Kerfeldbacteria bacterium]|nr:hypothetical protein [Candidatus Kerfeldbacteria bacterium]